jgi:hypothetical protein
MFLLRGLNPISVFIEQIYQRCCHRCYTRPNGLGWIWIELRMVQRRQKNGRFACIFIEF